MPWISAMVCSVGVSVTGLLFSGEGSCCVKSARLLSVSAPVELQLYEGKRLLVVAMTLAAAVSNEVDPEAPTMSIT